MSKSRDDCNAGVVFTCVPEGYTKPMLVQIYLDGNPPIFPDLTVFGKILQVYHVNGCDEGKLISNELRKGL